jgi:hypothetical protein
MPAQAYFKRCSPTIQHIDFRLRFMFAFVNKLPIKFFFFLMAVLSISLLVAEISSSQGWSQEKPQSTKDLTWLDEIETIFMPSTRCKQCHDRHLDEWKGMRERSEDLHSFGRMEGALPHGTALKSPVFRTVLGLWLQTHPTHDQRTKCLACHVPAATDFPQYTDRIIGQVMRGPK